MPRYKLSPIERAAEKERKENLRNIMKGLDVKNFDDLKDVFKMMVGEMLEEIYAVVFMDAIHFHVRSEGQIIKKAVYIAIGINMEGQKEVLGMWVGENESAKFWLSVLNSIKARGVEDILIACIDGLTGFTNAIEAVYPKTEIQQCIIYIKSEIQRNLFHTKA